jgi:molecular chaperone GrpE
MGKEHRIPVNRTSNDAQTQNLTTSSETEHEPDREAQAGTEEVGEKVQAQEDADPIRKLQDQLKSKEDEAKQSYDRLLRVSAEFENYKKRAAREMYDFRKYANQSLLREFLTVVDNLELAQKTAESEREIDQRLVEGLDITLKEIHRIFERFDVKTIEAVGKPFDPTYHEAVMRQETEDHPENTVVDEYQKGYLLRDRLLRPAMVVVAMPKVANNQVNKPPDNES